jgi:hypothetical protein
VSLNVVPLETIAKRAGDNHYDLESIPWDKGVDFSRYFFPEHLTPLFHCPVYEQLTEPQRLTYNQLYGQATNEQFIFLEERFLVQFLGNLMKKKRHEMPADLVEALDNFVVEEIKHTEMFRKLARLSNAERYNDSDYYFLRLGRAEGGLLDWMAKRPDFFNFWCVMGLAFEEKTIDYFRHYQRHAKERPDKPLDPLYYEIHKLHMLDEVRHVQIDHHLVKLFYETQGAIGRKINVKVISKMLQAYARPKRTSIRVAEGLVEAHPELKPKLETICAQLRALPWSAITYTPKNVPQTYALFEEYPELRHISANLLAYEPAAS